MTTFLDSRDSLVVQHAAQRLRDWQQGQQNLKVALVYGGVSAEDQLYIAKSPTEQLSITALTGALTEIGVRFGVLNPCDPTFVQDLTAYDVVLSNLHGPYGEDGRLQGLLDYLRKPYCGSGVAASAVAADKILCKRLMLGLGVPTPGWQVWNGSGVTWSGRPVMVKPPLGGSSVGMSLIKDEADLLVALARAAAVSESSVLVEEYVSGLPVTVGLLELPGGEVLAFPPLATEVREAEFYDADAKLDGAVSVTVADLAPDVLATLADQAKTLWDGLGCSGSARVDFMVTPDGQPYALEVNTTPGMSRDSNFVTGAALCGFVHSDVVLAMLHEAVVRPTYDVPLPSPIFTGVPAPREPAA